MRNSIVLLAGTAFLWLSGTIAQIEAQAPAPVTCPTNGDYNGNGTIDTADYDAWQGDFLSGQAALSCFEYWRRANLVFNEPTSCLNQSGATITLNGNQAVRYDTRGNPLADDTKIDARGAVWHAQWPVQDSFDYPVILAGGTNVCFAGGEIVGDYPEQIGNDAHATWDRLHSTRALGFKTGNFTLEGVRVHNFGDAIAIRADEASSFTIKGVHLSHIRDDCVENDWLRGGVIEDSLLDGCYTAFSTRSECQACNGSQRTMTIRDSLIRMEPMQGVYQNRGQIPGHGSFFKWDSSGVSPKLALHNNIFRADQDSSGGNLGIPQGKLAECTNNTMVWLGAGSYPDPLPETFNNQSCFTLTTDRAVWDNAVAAWKNRQGGGGPAPTATPTPAVPAPTIPSGSALPTEQNFKVAFIGDSGAGAEFRQVLQLIKQEQADLVLHQGDFGYSAPATEWVAAINGVLGPDFPYLGSDGNHDNWAEYEPFFRDRLQRMGLASVQITSGGNYATPYRGLQMVFVREKGDDPEFIRQSLEGNNHIWKICSWHHNMNDMQAGGKGDSVGWPSYQLCQDFGAITATAHEHSYSRTYSMSASHSNGQHGSLGLPNEMQVAPGNPGKFFVFVSGLGGKSGRDYHAAEHDDDSWWATIYTSTRYCKNACTAADFSGQDHSQDIANYNYTHGVLFIEFFVDGDPYKARGYFKNVAGDIIDEFTVTASTP